MLNAIKHKIQDIEVPSVPRPPEQYYLLVTSLPAFKPLEENKRLPVTRLNLMERLESLPQETQNQIHEIVDALLYIGFEKNAELATISESLLKKAHKYPRTIQNVIRFFLEQRAILALLRSKIKRKALPNNFDLFGIYFDPKTMETIRSKWSDRDFGLKISHPYIEDLYDSLERGDMQTVKNKLVRMRWKKIKDETFDTNFGVDAIILYVLQWRILRQWFHNKPDESLALINEEINRKIEETEPDYEQN